MRSRTVDTYWILSSEQDESYGTGTASAYSNLARRVPKAR
jgi:hypothetical protein